jgi:hypothetical protein
MKRKQGLQVEIVGTLAQKPESEECDKLIEKHEQT